MAHALPLGQSCFGRVPWRERQAHVATIGAVFGQRMTLWWDLPVIESLELLLSTAARRCTAGLPQVKHAAFRIYCGSMGVCAIIALS